MTILASLTVTAAQAGVVTTPLQFRDGTPESLAFQATFAYGSGGTSVSAWIQTTIDGGVTWTDAANFTFTNASARSFMALSALTTANSPLLATDGTLAANTAVGAPIGPEWRVKYTTVGTYAGGTTLRIDAAANRGRLTSLV